MELADLPRNNAPRRAFSFNASCERCQIVGQVSTQRAISVATFGSAAGVNVMFGAATHCRRQSTM
jgi:hypothetical protein